MKSFCSISLGCPYGTDFRTDAINSPDTRPLMETGDGFTSQFPRSMTRSRNPNRFSQHSKLCQPLARPLHDGFSGRWWLCSRPRCWCFSAPVWFCHRAISSCFQHQCRHQLVFRTLFCRKQQLMATLPTRTGSLRGALASAHLYLWYLVPCQLSILGLWPTPDDFLLLRVGSSTSQNGTTY